MDNKKGIGCKSPSTGDEKTCSPSGDARVLVDSVCPYCGIRLKSPVELIQHVFRTHLST